MLLDILLGPPVTLSSTRPTKLSVHTYGSHLFPVSLWRPGSRVTKKTTSQDFTTPPDQGASIGKEGGSDAYKM